MPKLKNYLKLAAASMLNALVGFVRTAQADTIKIAPAEPPSDGSGAYLRRA